MIPSGTTFLVVDCETTGFDPTSDKVCEVGAVWIDPSGNVLDEFESLVNPEMPIPPAASAVHHIIEDDVKGAPSLGQVYSAIAARHPYDVVVGHNLVDFDIRFLPMLRSGRPLLDTLRLAQRTWPELESHKNFFLAYKWGLITGSRSARMAHSALADAKVTAKNLVCVLQSLLDRAKDPDSVTIEALSQWQMKPRMLHTIRFGKHAGTKFSEIPRDYLVWVVNKSGMSDPDLLFTCKTLLGR